MLRAGGSAADAAVAASAVLAVTTQHMCGMGGDLLALVEPGVGQPPRALMAVGRAGSGSDADRLVAEGHRRMPFRGDVRTVTVPGCVDGWLALHEAYGRLPLDRVLAPAVAYATDGFPVAPLLAQAIPGVADVAGGDELVGDEPPRPGDVRRRPRLGAALAAIARGGRDAWYGGAFGQGLLSLGAGVFSTADLATNLAEWGDPVHLQVGGSTVWSTPPPSQGYLVAASAWIADACGALASDDLHLLVEAARVAGHDRPARLHAGADPNALLDLDDLAARAERVSDGSTCELRPPAEAGGTIYLCAMDAAGMTVSLSQSNAAGFGAHLAVPEVGVFLHNRGIGFSLEPGHPARLRPGARPPHTLCPSLLVSPQGSTAVGTMGGDAQPQIVLQLLAALASGATPAAALARPRWLLAGPTDTGFDQWEPWPSGLVAPVVALEAEAPAQWADRLVQSGHEVQRAAAGRGFGHAHIARRTAGVLAGASDSRAGTGDAQGW